MGRFIPIDKMKKLREACVNGDERAKKILKAQLGDEDFSVDLEDYFKPVEEPVQSEEVVNVSDKEVPEVKDISQEIMDLISLCDKKTLDIANDPDITDATKKGALSILGEMKQSCLDNLEKFGKLMNSLKPKEEVVE